MRSRIGLVAVGIGLALSVAACGVLGNSEDEGSSTSNISFGRPGRGRPPGQPILAEEDAAPPPSILAKSEEDAGPPATTDEDAAPPATTDEDAGPAADPPPPVDPPPADQDAGEAPAP